MDIQKDEAAQSYARAECPACGEAFDEAGFVAYGRLKSEDGYLVKFFEVHCRACEAGLDRSKLPVDLQRQLDAAFARSG